MVLVHELVPAASSIAVLFNPTNPGNVGNLSFQQIIRNVSSVRPRDSRT